MLCFYSTPFQTEILHFSLQYSYLTLMTVTYKLHHNINANLTINAVTEVHKNTSNSTDPTNSQNTVYCTVFVTVYILYVNFFIKQIQYNSYTVARVPIQFQCVDEFNLDVNNQTTKNKQTQSL